MANPTLRLSRSSALSHFISLNSSAFERGSLLITKDTPIIQEISTVFGSFVPGTEERVQIYFLIHQRSPFVGYVPRDFEPLFFLRAVTLLPIPHGKYFLLFLIHFFVVVVI